MKIRGIHIILNYYRQKEHTVLRYLISFTVYCLLLVHVFMGVLFYLFKETLGSSIIIQEFGKNIQQGTQTILFMQIIMIFMVVIQTLFAQCSRYYLEKQMYLKVLLFLLALVAGLMFLAQASVANYYSGISNWMNTQCKKVPLDPGVG